MKHELNLTTDFINATGTRISVISIENSEGKSIWIGDFDDGELSRLSSIPSLIDKRGQIIEECGKILEECTPTDYNKPYLKKDSYGYFVEYHDGEIIRVSPNRAKIHLEKKDCNVTREIKESLDV
tara:strand:- start:215 stop:589 length:375 start_codon:yes stop_codon:yes gene_type:complete